MSTDSKDGSGSTRLLCSLTLIFMLMSWSFSLVAASTSVCVYIDPSGMSGVEGIVSDGRWIGEIPIKVGDNQETVATSGESTKAYCMQYDKTVGGGRIYSADVQPTADTEEWRAVSYILTWFPPVDDDEAAVSQVAIWRILNNTRDYDYVKPPWIGQALDNDARKLVHVAFGKDVIRQGDIFKWVAPLPGNVGNMTNLAADPGETLTLTAKITESDGTTPRPNVRVKFSAMIDSSPLAVNPTVDHTDGTGHVEVTLTVPSDSAGSEVVVKADTRGVWPKLYLDLENDEYQQDLVGFDTRYQLTVSTSLWIFATIFVVPEIPFGTLAAVATCLGAYMVKTRKPVKVRSG
jgi:hypothetical protein